MSASKTSKKKLVRGKDWHRWYWLKNGDKVGKNFYNLYDKRLWEDNKFGHWVRVKFVEVK